MLKTITIKFNNGVTHTFQRLHSKFEIMDRVYIVREQFPVIGAHAITIHKCQGMTLKELGWILVTPFSPMDKVLLHFPQLLP